MTIERALQAAGDGPILIALSGGGDSVALLHVLTERVGAARLRAVVVDHALREGSAADAARAASFARALGVEARIQTLSWSAAETRNQQNARRKRYAALCDAARGHSARIIAVAHTADDQAETVFMRAAKGSGWRGLAGMAEIAPAPVWPEGRGVLLARPLLGERRAALRDLLRTRRAEWIEDPANANPAFERVRVRARLAELERDGVDPMRLARFALQLRVLADAVDADASTLIARAARFEGPEVILDLSACDGPPETRRRALSVLIAAAAGAEREPAPAALERLDARIAEPSFRGASLGGARLRRRGETLHISRDPGAIEGRAGVEPSAAVILPPNEDCIWDGRLRLRARRPGIELHPALPEPVLRAGEDLFEDLLQASDCNAEWLLAERVALALGAANVLTSPHSVCRSGAF